MSRLSRWSLAAGAVVLVAALLAPAAADWLVTRDGGRIETEGPWKVESRLVVFKRADGTLSSLRLSDVDLAASERLTREMEERERAEEGRAQEPPPRRPVVARLTERDLPPVEAPPRPETEASEAEGRAAADPLEIAEWREITEARTEGVEFAGTVRNRSEGTAVGVEVTATLFDREGEEIGAAEGVLTATALRDGESAAFRVSFPGVYDYARVVFQVEGTVLRTAPAVVPEATVEPPG